MKKRGQFYLVAALVIIAVIASLTVVYNETKILENDLVFYDLSEEINFEILQLLDSGYFNAITPQQLNDSINSIMLSYSKTYPQTNIIIIYGDRNKVNVLAYFTDASGTICFQGCFTVTEKRFYSRSYNVTDGTISLKINNVSYPFNVDEYGQNFYLVLKSEDQSGQIFTTTTESECTIDQDCNGAGEYCLNGRCQTIIEEPACGGREEICCQGNTCDSDNLYCYSLIEESVTILPERCYKNCTDDSISTEHDGRDSYCNDLNSTSNVNLKCKVNTNKCEVHPNNPDE